MKDPYYVYAWAWTDKQHQMSNPEHAALIDVAPNYYHHVGPNSCTIIKAYTRREANNYIGDYKLVTRKEWETLYGKVEYP